MVNQSGKYLSETQKSAAHICTTSRSNHLFAIRLTLTALPATPKSVLSGTIVQRIRQARPSPTRSPFRKHAKWRQHALEGIGSRDLGRCTLGQGAVPHSIPDPLIELTSNSCLSGLLERRFPARDGGPDCGRDILEVKHTRRGLYQVRKLIDDHCVARLLYNRGEKAPGRGTAS